MTSRRCPAPIFTGGATEYCVINQLPLTIAPDDMHSKRNDRLSPASCVTWLTCQLSGWNDVLYSMMNCRAVDDDVTLSLVTSPLTCFHSSCTTRALHDTRRTSNGALGTSTHRHVYTQSHLHTYIHTSTVIHCLSVQTMLSNTFRNLTNFHSCHSVNVKLWQANINFPQTPTASPRSHWGTSVPTGGLQSPRLPGPYSPQLKIPGVAIATGCGSSGSNNKRALDNMDQLVDFVSSHQRKRIIVILYIWSFHDVTSTLAGAYLMTFYHSMRSLQRIVALLPRCSSVCPSVCLSVCLGRRALWSHGENIEQPAAHSVYLHLSRQHHRSITSDVASMTDNCMNTKDTWVTVTSLRGYCTKIHTNSIICIVYCKL